MTELEVATEAARAAGRVLADAGARPERVTHKGSVDLVTEVDLACERAIRQVLTTHTPDIPILGEEEGGGEGAGTRWVVDPLDGTTNFVHGFPFYCVSVALEVDGEPAVGVVLDPVRDQLYRAARGEGATCNDRPMRVTGCTDLHEALLATGFPYERAQMARFLLARVQRFIERAQGIRRAGSAALDLAMVADGRVDGFWEFGLKRWDIAASWLLVEEAGGRVSDHEGHPIGAGVQQLAVLATNGHLHEVMMAELAACGG